MLVVFFQRDVWYNSDQLHDTLNCICVFRKQSSPATHNDADVPVAAGLPVHTSDMMDVEPVNAVTTTTEQYNSLFTLDSPQSKRPAIADVDASERDDYDRGSKRRRQNSTMNTESSSSLSVPSDRSPINASYISVQRYRTRVIDCFSPVFFSGL